MYNGNARRWALARLLEYESIDWYPKRLVSRA
jgi:hypothetical protein